MKTPTREQASTIEGHNKGMRVSSAMPSRGGGHATCPTFKAGSKMGIIGLVCIDYEKFPDQHALRQGRS